MAVLLPTRRPAIWSLGCGSCSRAWAGFPRRWSGTTSPVSANTTALTVGARGSAGTLGTRIYQTATRDPEAKGVVERANGFL